MNEVSAQGQKADICHGHVASHLSHPLFVRMRRDAGDVHSTGSQVYEEQNLVRHQPALPAVLPRHTSSYPSVATPDIPREPDGRETGNRNLECCGHSELAFG